MLLGPKAVALFAIGTLLLVTTGCGRSDSEDPTPTTVAPAPSIAAPPTPTPINPVAALRRSGEVMKGLEAFHFRLHHEKGGLELLPGTLIREVEGDVVKPDGLSVSFSGSVGNGVRHQSQPYSTGRRGVHDRPLKRQMDGRADRRQRPGFLRPEPRGRGDDVRGRSARSAQGRRGRRPVVHAGRASGGRGAGAAGGQDPRGLNSAGRG